MIKKNICGNRMKVGPLKEQTLMEKAAIMKLATIKRFILRGRFFKLAE